MEEKAGVSQGGTGAGSSTKPITTFVQVDTNTFREVVQRLTGPSASSSPNHLTSSEAAAAAATNYINEGTTCSLKVAGAKRPTSKLHERRQWSRPKLEIVKQPPNFHFRPQIPPDLLGSPLGTPSANFSKLSILEQQENKRESESESESAATSCGGIINSQEEEKAIKERRFYLHPSPRSSKPDGYAEPELLTLFPLTSTTPKDS